MSIQNEPVIVAQPSSLMKSKKTMKKTSFRKPFLVKYPGHLSSQGTLQIKTRTGQKHFLCLLKFAKGVSVIYRAAKQDDPYADARLLEIESALENAQRFIQEKMDSYQPLVPTATSLSLPLVDTQNPLELPISFSTPYAHMAARILVEFDTLIRCIISLHHWGLLAEMPLHQLLQQLSKPIFQLWETAKRFQLTGLTRAALMEPIVHEATSAMKPLDSRVLHKTLRAKYAPRIFITTTHKNSSTETIKYSPTDFSTSTPLT